MLSTSQKSNKQKVKSDLPVAQEASTKKQKRPFVAGSHQIYDSMLPTEVPVFVPYPSFQLVCKTSVVVLD
jgi:hypothetical protein